MFHRYGFGFFANELAALGNQEAGNQEATMEKATKKPKDNLKIQIGEDGIPLWPTAEAGNPWNLETKKAVIRNFLTVHYRTFSYVYHVLEI